MTTHLFLSFLFFTMSQTYRQHHHLLLTHAQLRFVYLRQSSKTFLSKNRLAFFTVNSPTLNCQLGIKKRNRFGHKSTNSGSIRVQMRLKVAPTISRRKVGQFVCFWSKKSSRFGCFFIKFGVFEFKLLSFRSFCLIFAFLRAWEQVNQLKGVRWASEICRIK